jgi:hypothetical protein
VNQSKYYEIIDQITIGRTTGEITCPEDGRMSGKHAQVTLENAADENVAYIQDLASKNRTILGRVEIVPNQKIQLKNFCLIEVGDQQLILTDNNSVNLSDINEMIEKHLRKPIIKLETEELVPKATVIVEVSMFEQIQTKEGRISQIQTEITSLEQNARNDIKKLDEAKEKIITNAKAKRLELSNIMTVLKIEVDEAKVHLAKMKTEIEQKKKKIINLKDLPTDSTEELPE